MTDQDQEISTTTVNDLLKFGNVNYFTYITFACSYKNI